MLKRELNAVQATAVNMIDMVGIGPFVTTAIVVSTMGNTPAAILAWVFGAALSFVDAAIWSELGAKIPKAGGSYAFLRETYGTRWGKLMAFLFVWQTVFQAPLVVTSGSLGFAKYLGYLVDMTPLVTHLVAAALIAVLVAMLYRRIRQVGVISVVLWIAVIITMVWIIAGGLIGGTPAQAFDWSNTVIPSGSQGIVWGALGIASISTIYSYLGYYNVCHLGAEVQQPEKIIPRSMYLSIAGITVLYLGMQVAVMAVLPAPEIAGSSFVVSTFMERLYGGAAGQVATALVLLVALSSLFSVMLGYTRIPYAAAKDGLFFAVFGKEHPRLNFPHISLLVLGGLGVVFSLTLTIEDSIKSIITMRIFTQFIAQAVGLMVYRKRVGAAAMPWRMWLYPIPVLLTIVGWLWIFASAKPLQQIVAIAAPLVGALVYVVVIRKKDVV